MTVLYSFVIEVPGTPLAHQSVRFTKTGRRYQPKKVTDAQLHIKMCAWEVINNLNLEHALPTTNPIRVKKIEFRYRLPKRTKKTVQRTVLDQGYIFKTTRPDLQDNLMKGFFDALTGIVYKDDSQIIEVCASRKLYVLEESYTTVVFEILEPIER